jgi:methanogenic corrinoid protein MtbC1
MESLAATTRTSLDRCLREHDRAGAVRSVLAATDAGLAIEDLYSQVLQPFLASVGSEWQQGRTAVWEEHLIVGAVRAAVEALYPRVLERKAAVPQVPVTVAFFCPPEETHDLGLRMLADRFDLRGFRTVYVGAGTPVEEMVKCVQAEGASVVCLSASTHFQKAALHNVITRLRERLPGVRLVAGGPAFAQGRAGWEEYVVGDVERLLDELAAEAAGAEPNGDTHAESSQNTTADTGAPSDA